MFAKNFNELVSKGIDLWLSDSECTCHSDVAMREAIETCAIRMKREITNCLTFSSVNHSGACDSSCVEFGSNFGYI